MSARNMAAIEKNMDHVVANIDVVCRSLTGNKFNLQEIKELVLRATRISDSVNDMVKKILMRTE